MSEYVIKKTVARLYAEPSLQASCVDEALCGMGVEVLEDRCGGWCRVRTEYGYEGFVDASDLAVPRWRGDTDCVDGVYVANGTRCLLKRMVYATAADLLTAPDVKAPILQTLTTGCVVYEVHESRYETTECASGGAEATENSIAADKRAITDENGGLEGWLKVATADGRVGYMRSVYVRPAVARRDALRDRIIEAAFAYAGAQYRWGGKTPLGVDCSGLCFMAYWLNGVTIYRDAKIMPGYPITKIPPETAGKGDLLFFPGHVGLCLGDGRMLHSSIAGNGVNVVSLSPELPGRDTALAARMIEAGSVFGRGGGVMLYLP